MAILALDLASQTGWAVYSKGMDRPHFGSVTIKRKTGTNGEAGVRLWKFIEEKADLYGGFTDVVFEAQHLAESVNPQVMYLLIGMGFLVEMWAHDEGARVFSVPISTWRKEVLGQGSFRTKRDEGGKVIASGRQQAKQRVMDWCNDLGWYPPDDNAADACGIMDYYLRLLPATRGIVLPWRDATFMAGVRRG